MMQESGREEVLMPTRYDMLKCNEKESGTWTKKGRKGEVSNETVQRSQQHHRVPRESPDCKRKPRMGRRGWRLNGRREPDEKQRLGDRWSAETKRRSGVAAKRRAGTVRGEECCINRDSARKATVELLQLCKSVGKCVACTNYNVVCVVIGKCVRE